MKTLFKKMETLMSAAAFAEGNDHQTALEILKEGDERTAQVVWPVRSTFPGNLAVRPAGSK